jgi:small GTP-binding protein
MNLSCGIVGLPNAGKSTLFNALATRRLAETAPRPFTTIEPHEASVAVPDRKLDKLYELLHAENIDSEKVPATVTFIDIAGLVKGAHKGEGLGNQFLAKIREVDAIVHVVRAFNDPGISHQHATYEPGSINQVLEDIETINIELELGEIEKKPTIYVLNVDEGNLDNAEYSSEVEKKFKEKALLISAGMEEEMIEFSKDEREDYFKDLTSGKSGLERLIIHTYSLLDLLTFYTIKGGKEIHAWSLKRGSSVIGAAGKVHTDFAKNFIKSEVINVDLLLELGSWNKAREKGKIRLEGKDYTVKDQDVIEFLVGK